MGLKNDAWIIDMAKRGMISPFSDKQIRCGLDDTPFVSYGVSSYGYDMRVGGSFKIFTNTFPGIIDPKNFINHVKFHELSVGFGEFVVVPPNSFALASSVEIFNIPRNVLCICVGKSTYARCGIVVNVTAFEPEWCGHVTIEISNTTPLPAKIYPYEGIAQVLFFEADDVCNVSYADKGGKYQNQVGIILPKV